MSNREGEGTGKTSLMQEEMRWRSDNKETPEGTPVKTGSNGVATGNSLGKNPEVSGHKQEVTMHLMFWWGEILPED